MPSTRYQVIMTSPQLSVRSARARDLAHKLSQREKRPIHAIVEDALTEYTKRHPEESAANFLLRMRSIGAGVVTDDDLTDLEASIDQNRKPHKDIEQDAVLATRNIKDFKTTSARLINPWD